MCLEPRGKNKSVLTCYHPQRPSKGTCVSLPSNFRLCGSREILFPIGDILATAAT